MLTVETFDTIGEAARAMRENTRYLAGGTLVMGRVNYGDQRFDRIVRTRDRSLGEIRAEGGGVRIGAGVTMTQIMGSPDLAFLAPAAHAVGGPAIRNMATVGGNLFAPHPFGDFAVALLALDAMVATTDGPEVPVEQLLAARGERRGLVTSVTVPRPMGDDFRYLKVRRSKPKGASVMAIAAWSPRQGGRLANVRIAFGAMGRDPLRAKAAERALEGATLDAGGIQRALEVATEGLDPPDDALASAWYRREVAPVHLRRLLLGEGKG
jgi:CO/xanthine dehydrogenase FAD-binding subunit